MSSKINDVINTFQDEIDEIVDKSDKIDVKKKNILKKVWYKLASESYKIAMVILLPIATIAVKGAVELWFFNFELAMIYIVIAIICFTMIVCTTMAFLVVNWSKKKDKYNRSYIGNTIKLLRRTETKNIEKVKIIMDEQENRHKEDVVDQRRKHEEHVSNILLKQQEQLQQAYTMISDNVIAFSEQINRLIEGSLYKQMVDNRKEMKDEIEKEIKEIKESEVKPKKKTIDLINRKVDNRTLPELPISKK